jgi:hypothetical protein
MALVARPGEDLHPDGLTNSKFHAQQIVDPSTNGAGGVAQELDPT